MTVTELELKARRFAAKMSDKELDKLIGIIEDIRDARAIERSLAKRQPSVSGEDMETYLARKFGSKFKQLLTA
jgi:hypothetical protein